MRRSALGLVIDGKVGWQPASVLALEQQIDVGVALQVQGLARGAHTLCYAADQYCSTGSDMSEELVACIAQALLRCWQYCEEPHRPATEKRLDGPCLGYIASKPI